MDPRLEVMVEAARAGGAVALEHYRRGFSVWAGGDPRVMQSAPGVTVEQRMDSLRREARAGQVWRLQAIDGG